MNNHAHQTVNCIDSLSLFNTLTPEQRLLVYKLIRHKSFRANQQIYSPGEKSKCNLYY